MELDWFSQFIMDWPFFMDWLLSSFSCYGLVDRNIGWSNWLFLKEIGYDVILNAVLL